MSSCTFSIDFSGPAEQLLSKAQNAITSMGGSFTGTTEAGSLSISTPLGQVSGTYSISGGAVHFDITDKPIFLSCGMIEAQLRKHI